MMKRAGYIQLLLALHQPNMTKVFRPSLAIAFQMQVISKNCNLGKNKVISRIPL